MSDAGKFDKNNDLIERLRQTALAAKAGSTWTINGYMVISAPPDLLEEAADALAAGSAEQPSMKRAELRPSDRPEYIAPDAGGVTGRRDGHSSAASSEREIDWKARAEYYLAQLAEQRAAYIALSSEAPEAQEVINYLNDCVEGQSDAWPMEKVRVSKSVVDDIIRLLGAPASATRRFISVAESLPTTADLVVVRDADGQWAFDSYENGRWQSICEDQGEPVEWYPLPSVARADSGADRG